jgi:Calcineurin-like phosphoesterase
MKGIRGVVAMALIACVGAAASAGAATLLPRQSVWRFQTGADLASAWSAPGYVEVGWGSGPGILGFGETYITTLVPSGPDASHRPPTTYFRTTFTGADPSLVTSLTLGANYDDGFVAYLNGQEVARRGLGTGAVTYALLAASHEGGVYEAIDLTPFKNALVAGANVLAVEVHQTSATSTDLVLDMDLQASVQGGPPVVTRGPYLQIGTPASVRMRWRTDQPTDSRVAVGPGPLNLSQNFDDGTLTTEHEIAVTGLSPHATYFYSVGTSTTPLLGGDPSYTFVTAPPIGSTLPLRAWVIGDAGTAAPAQLSVRDGYASWAGTRSTDLWLMLGDNAYGAGTDAEYQADVFDVYPGLLRKSVLWPTRGNHDALYAGANNDYYDIFSLPMAAEAGGLASGSEAYYSFDWGNVHFICLDSEGTSLLPDSPMMIWLRTDVAATLRDWVIAFWHHPPYTKGSHNSDDPNDSGGKMRDMRQVALPILDSTGVDLVLCGHSHSYERSFLLNGHYGLSTTLAPSMKVDAGDGRAGGDGAYEKPTLGTGAFEGAVYVVAGSSGQAAGGTLDHPVMVSSQNVLGSLVLDIQGNQLDAHFIDDLGVARDSFTILKGALVDAGPRWHAGEVTLTASPNPFSRSLNVSFVLPRAGHARVAIHDLSGRRIGTLLDGEAVAGVHMAVWSGRRASGEPVPSGVYFAVLEFAGEKRATRIVRVR